MAITNHAHGDRELRKLARRIRLHAVRMTQRAKSSHVGGSLSMAELLAVLYRKILRVEPGDRGRPGPRPLHPQQGA